MPDSEPGPSRRDRSAAVVSRMAMPICLALTYDASSCRSADRATMHCLNAEPRQETAMIPAPNRQWRRFCQRNT